MDETRIKLSAIWVATMLVYLLGDVLRIFAGDSPISLLMLGGAIMMEISIVMIILSRVLNHKVNRWSNIVTGIITIVFIWGGASSEPHYLFIGTVETICLLLIIWFAWRWTKQKGGAA